MKIGSLELDSPVVMAPMCGCTDLPFRRIAREFGCGLAFAEMVKDRAVIQKNRRTLELIATADWDRPLGLQLAGREPEILTEAARILEDHGASLIDINLGCPVRKIVKEGCGSALLREPDQVGRMVEAMVRAVDVPVTIKIRTGFDDEPEGTYIRVVKNAESAGAAGVTIHGRTRLQKFGGLSNHQAIAALKEAVSIPVIGNGNIHSAQDAKKMIDETGCDGVMVARGALGNPWIYRDIKAYLESGRIPAPPTIAERAAVLRKHFRYLLDFYGNPRAFLLVRRVLHWFVKSSPGAAQLRERCNTIGTLEEFEKVVSDFESCGRKAAG